MDYWSNSKLADLIRGTKKPLALTSEEWLSWERAAYTESKFRYWLAEDFLDFLQKVLTSPRSLTYSLAYYLNNRFVVRTHALVASKKNIKRGSWHDLSGRFLPAMFDSLRDFVEIECAWMNLSWRKEDFKKYNVPWWRKHGLYKGWRSKASGIDYLNWSASLIYDEAWGVKKSDPNYGKPTKQALDAKEILALYYWWTEIRERREDPYELSDYSNISDLLQKKYGGLGLNPKSKEEQKLISHSLAELDRIEKAYEDEDEEMMIRLIKVRNGLWT